MLDKMSTTPIFLPRKLQYTLEYHKNPLRHHNTHYKNDREENWAETNP